MTRSVWALALLAACGPDYGDVDFVLVGGDDLAVTDATARVDTLRFLGCDDDAVTVGVYDELDLFAPRPVAAPHGSWCGLTVTFAADPVDGSLVLAGTFDAGTPFTVALDPGDATMAEPFVHDSADGILLLDAAALIDVTDLEGLDPAEVEPDDALAEALADEVGDALSFYTQEQDARDVYLDLWPDFDLSLSAEVNVTGCQGPVWDSGIDDGGTDGGTDDGGTDDGGTDDGGTGDGGGGGSGGGCDGSGCDGGGCDGSGCSGGSSGCSGGSCDAGCDAGCSTLGFAPGWVALLSALVIRRRGARAARTLNSDDARTD